jgi:hypothetical protein
MSYTNRPIAPSPATVQEWLAETQATLVARRDEILAGYNRFLKAHPDGIQDETTQARAADFAGGKGIMSAFVKECDGNRSTEKGPFLAGGRAVDAFFSTLTDPVERCQKDMRVKMTAFANKLEAQRREAARLEAERLAAEAALAEDHAIDTMAEADLQAAMDVAREAEAAAALADAKASALSQTRGELGTVVSLRTSWKADYAASDLMALVKAVAEGRAPLYYLTFADTRINYAIRSEKVREIPGVRIREERTVV